MGVIIEGVLKKVKFVNQLLKNALKSNVANRLRRCYTIYQRCAILAPRKIPKAIVFVGKAINPNSGLKKLINSSFS